MKKIYFLIGLCVISSQAAADTISIPLDDSMTVTEDSELYSCNDKNVEATYYNAKPADADKAGIALVKLEFDDKTVIATQVLSGSGTKYAGDIYYWWTKGGDEASLYNIMENPEQDKPVTCRLQ